MAVDTFFYGRSGQAVLQLQGSLVSGKIQFYGWGCLWNLVYRMRGYKQTAPIIQCFLHQKEVTRSAALHANTYLGSLAESMQKHAMVALQSAKQSQHANLSESPP